MNSELDGLFDTMDQLNLQIWECKKRIGKLQELGGNTDALVLTVENLQNQVINISKEIDRMCRQKF